MKRFIRLDGLVVSGIVAIAAAWPLAQVAAAGQRHRPAVPAAIEVPTGNEVFLVGHAVGVQIYSCDATAGGVAWSAAVPRANLYDDRGRLVVTHFAGPTWQARDGSRVVGQRVNGVTVDPTAIPWLLLSAASTTAGQHGDRLVKTTFIQRIATTGGLTPAAASCNATTAGAKVEVPYTADYYFWKARRGRYDGKDSILIATRDVEGRRLGTISAVLEGRYVSTLITDIATAHELLRLAKPRRRGSRR